MQVRYGPRDAFLQALANPSTGSKDNPAKAGENLELTIGLSTRPPWECTLCRVKCTSEETLQGHAQGKKHRAKARAAAKAQAEKDAPAEGANGAASGEDKKGEGSENGTEMRGAVKLSGTVATTVEKQAEGKASLGGGPEEESKGIGEKKRKKRDVGEEDLEQRVNTEIGKKKGKKQKKDVALAVQDAGKEIMETDADEKAESKTEKKKGKKRKGEKVTDVREGVEEEASKKVRETGEAEESNVGNAVVKDSSGVAKKKSKKEKRGGVSEDAASKPSENGSVDDVTAGREATAVREGENGKQSGRSEAKPKKAKAGKVLDEKLYWEELAEKGRKKKQAESPALSDRERPESHGANEGQGHPSTAAEKSSRKESKKRREETITEVQEEGGQSGKNKRKKGSEENGEMGTVSGVANGSGEGTTKERDAADAAAAVIKPGKLRKLMQAALQEVITLRLDSVLWGEPVPDLGGGQGKYTSFYAGLLSAS